MEFDSPDIDRTVYGWHGRHRMNGRNRLAKVAREHDGVLQVPSMINDGVPLVLSAAWLDAQKVKVANIGEAVRRALRAKDKPEGAAA